MRTKTVTRYFCDHCSKGMFKKPSIAAHEAVCYRNPKRHCSRCLSAPDYAISPERRKAILEDGEKCQTKAGECPDCLMAMVIQYNTRLDCEAKAFGAWVNYDMERFRSDRRDWDDEHQNEHGRYM